MSQLIRIKPKKQYQWQQDSKYLFIKIPRIGQPSLKNTQIFLSDMFLRLTNRTKKSTQILDLLYQIDYLSSQNKFILIDGILNVTIKKKYVDKVWEKLLIQGISISELKTRRKQSELRYQQNIKLIQQNKNILKIQYDRQATRQLMKFQQKQRNKLEEKKRKEKQNAINYIFQNNHHLHVKDKENQREDQSQKLKQKQQIALQQLSKQQSQQQQKQNDYNLKAKQQKYLSKHTNKQIFTPQDLKLQQHLHQTIHQHQQQIPIRKQNKISLKFTDKIYPNVATRDYHYTDPPRPKGINYIPPSRQTGLENTNPLWLKDKGDLFMNQKNYLAALDAYNQAIKIDRSQIKILMNRSLANIKLFNLDSAIHDCDTILLQMQKQIVNNQDHGNQSILDLVKIKTRKGLCLAWKGKLIQAKQLLQEQLKFPIDSQIQQQIQNCLQLINNRQQSILIKLKGDQCVKKQAYQQAIAHYDKSINIDNNQYSISNKCLCLNKLTNYQQSISQADEAIKIIQSFIIETVNKNPKNNQENTAILMKLLYRKSQAQQKLNHIKQAQNTLKKALNINADDKDIKQALHSLKYRQNFVQYFKLKQLAQKQLSQKLNPSEALKIYQNCLKILQNMENPAQYLSILQNQCVCYLKLQQYNNVISVSIRILNIVNNMKNKIMQLGQKIISLPKPTLNKIMVRTLVRRANAYLKTGQIYNAKGDLQKAVQIDPGEQSVRKQLDKLKTMIGMN